MKEQHLEAIRSSRTSVVVVQLVVLGDMNELASGCLEWGVAACRLSFGHGRAKPADY